MNEVLLANAVKFLSDGTVRASPTERQLAFLRQKGLSEDEVEEAFRRAGLTLPSSPASLPSSTNNQNSNAYSYPPAYNYDSYGNNPPEQLYQLARTSTLARWLLLLALLGSALAVIVRSLPGPVYARLQDLLSSFFDRFIMNNRKSQSSRKEDDEVEESRLQQLESMARKIDHVVGIVEGLSKRQQRCEDELLSMRFDHQRRFQDCREEGDMDEEEY